MVQIRTHLLTLHHRFNLALDLRERPHASRFLFFGLDDVKPELALHQVADLARFLRKTLVFKFRDRLASDNPAQFSALLGASRISRFLLSERGEICAASDLLEDIGGFSASLVHRLGIGLAVWYVSRQLDQNMPHTRALRQAVRVLI